MDCHVLQSLGRARSNKVDDVHLWNKLVDRCCIQVPWETGVPLLETFCEFEGLQMPGHSSKHHLAVLAIDGVVKDMILLSAAMNAKLLV